MTMTLDRAAAAPIVIDGLTFHRLTMRQLVDLSARWLSDDRAKLIASCDECGLSPLDKYERIKEFDESGLSITNVIRRIFTLQGAMDVLTAACEGDIANLTLHTDDIVSLAAKLVGVRLDFSDDSTNEHEGHEKKANDQPATG